MDDDQRLEWVLPARTGEFRGLELAHLDREDPDERRILIEAEHPEYAEALEAGDEILVDGQPMNPALHISMHEIVANQILELEPPETWATAKRLVDLGYDRHEVLHMLAGPVTQQVWQMMQDRRHFDRDEFVAELADLPESWEAARPSGSG